MNISEISGMLGELAGAGSVEGLLLTRRLEIIYSENRFEESQLIELVRRMEDVAAYYQGEKRSVEQLVLGFNEGNMLFLFDASFRLVITYSNPEDADILGKTARALLRDFQMHQLVDHMADGKSVEVAEKELWR